MLVSWTCLGLFRIVENGSKWIKWFKNAAKRTRQHARVSSTKSRLQPKVVFHRRSFSTKGCLSTKVIFHRKSSSTEGRLPPKVFFHQRSSSNRGGLPLKVSSTKGCLPPNITLWFILYLWEQSTYQISAFYLQYMMLDAWCNTLVDLIFVRAAIIPNLSLLPCLWPEFFFDETHTLTEKAICWGSMLPKKA